MSMQKVCVYCGSHVGHNGAFATAAKQLGTLCAQRGLTLVYGGGKVGLMGVLADAALAAGGKVIGIIPHFLIDLELAHAGLTQLIAVTSLHERKRQMAELSDAFVALPGGLGTLEELAEVFTWLQLDLHRKPVALLNVDGYYDHLLQFLNHMQTQRFLRREQLAMLRVNDNVESLLGSLECPGAIYPQNWMNRTDRT